MLGSGVEKSINCDAGAGRGDERERRRRQKGDENGFRLANAASQEDDKQFTVHLSDESFETYEIDPPPYTLNTTKKELKQMYYDMVSTR